MFPLGGFAPRWRTTYLGKVAERSEFRKYNYRIDLSVEQINEALLWWLRRLRSGTKIDAGLLDPLILALKVTGAHRRRGWRLAPDNKAGLC